MARKMGHTMYNIKEHNRIKMSVIVLNVRTPLIAKTMCVGYINIAQDNLCEIILVYLIFIYCLLFQVTVLLNA